MGYWPKKVKRRRGHWVNNLGRKLVWMGARGSHAHAYTNHPWKQHKRFYIEIGQAGSETGNSEDATLLRMARRMELY